MRYDISKATAPAMPTLEKCTECIKLLLDVLPISTKDHQRPPPMLYLCIVLRTQALALVFADSPRLRLHTPGNSTCRLRRQQKKSKK